MSGNIISYQVDPEDGLVHLRDVFKKKMPVSHALLARLKVQEKIKVNGEVTRTNYLLQPGDLVTVELDLNESSHIVPQNIPVDIIFEDADLMVINKPSGLAVHPVKNHLEGTLANAVTYYWLRQGESRLFRPINRLDKGTSGLILIAKSQYAHQAMFRQQKQGMVHRHYQALVEGIVETDHGCIDLPIGHADPGKTARRIIDPENGKSAITEYKVVKRYQDFTLLSLNLQTGRTHQIRVHLSHLGHPVCGDTIYGSPSPFISHQALHAGEVSFQQPRTGLPLTFEVPLPADIQQLISRLCPLA